MLRFFKRQKAPPSPRDPDEVAYQLLWSILDKKQRCSLEEKGYFRVGYRWRIYLHVYIRYSHTFLEQRVLWKWVRVGVRTPAQPVGLPGADQALNLLLHLKAHPKRVRRLKCGTYLKSGTV